MNKSPAACLRSLVLVSAWALGLLGAALPVAAQQTYYIYADHLDTPRLIENQSQQVVWTWDNDDPFGGNMANANPSGLGAFEFNLRFPGQYFDKETNLHYNYYRDYSPEIGRYIESDPIGLRGGINGYAYVANNPLSFTDPLGLQVPETQGRNREGLRPERERPELRPTTPAGPKSAAIVAQQAACMVECLKDYERKAQQYCTIVTVIFTAAGAATGGIGGAAAGGIACAVGCPILSNVVINPVSSCQSRCFR